MQADGGIAARKVTLLSRLLSRHKRLAHAADRRDEAGSTRSRERRDRNSAPSARPKPFQKMVDNSLAKKQKKVALCRTLSQGTPEQETKPDVVIGTPLNVDIHIQLVESPVSPLTPSSYSPPIIREPVRDPSFRLADLVPPEEQYDRLLQSSLSTNLIADFDAEIPVLSKSSESRPLGAVSASAALASLVCIACTVALGFSWLASISSVVTVSLALRVMNQHGAARNARSMALSKKAALDQKKRTLHLSNSNFRSRLVAAKASAARYDHVEEKLHRSLSLDGRQKSSRRLSAAAKQAEHLGEAKRRLRNQVLMAVSKAIIVSNKRSNSRMVLNPLGVDVIIAKLSTMERVAFDRKDLEQILEQHGSTQRAIQVLYRLVMDDKSRFIQYDLAAGATNQCHDRKMKAEGRRSFLRGFKK